MNNNTKKILAWALMISMIFNGTKGKAINDVYMPPEKIEIESQLEDKNKQNKLKRVLK